jgi:hypothetical protein
MKFSHSIALSSGEYQPRENHRTGASRAPTRIVPIIGFVLGVTEETVLIWLERGAHKAPEMNAHLLLSLPVTQVQLDEMWSFIKRKQAQQADTDGESTEP